MCYSEHNIAKSKDNVEMDASLKFVRKRAQ